MILTPVKSKTGCGVANHLLNVCKSNLCKMKYLQVHLNEQVVAREDEDFDNNLWEGEKTGRFNSLL